MKIFEFTLWDITIAPSYYGLMYALAFVLGYFLLRKEKWLNERQLDTLVCYVFFGVVLGGRLGYVFLYNFAYFLEHPGEILQPWL